MRRRSIAHLLVFLLVYVLVFTSIIVHECHGKESSEITIEASPEDITIGESTTIHGSITPTRVGVTVRILYRETGEPWSLLAERTTNETSQYSYVWAPSDTGTYEVKAYWLGDEDTYGDESPTITVDINAPPQASFIYTPETPTIDETVTFNASSSFDPDGTIVSYGWDFGDDSTGTGVTTTHAYTAAGTYTVTLIVTDNDTLTDNATRDITVSLKSPVASFIYRPTQPRVNEIVNFGAYDSYDPDGTIVSYGWDFGDDTTGTGVTTTHAYTAASTYTVVLNVTDNDGLSGTKSANITVVTVLNRPPIATFTESAETVYTGEAITFNASSSHDPDGTIESYFWDFGDGGNSTGMIVEHSYEDDGYYTVTLTVTDDDDATDTATSTKTVLNRSPVASFTESAEIGYINKTIYFNASDSYDSDGLIVSYFWDFGDGTNATGVAVEHAYIDYGNYTVTLTVTDDDDATDTATSTKEVTQRPPVAIFTESTETAYIGETIVFNASGSYDPDGNVTSYFWDFGDETSATGVTVDHAYGINGTFTVTLTVTDDDGASNSSSSTKTILKNKLPIPLFTESAETVYTGEVITFNASGSYDPDGNVTSYFWDFGDETSATGVTVDHAYADNGVYTVTLTVTDDDGDTASKSAVKAVSNRPPIALFTENPATALTGEIIHFDASDSYDSDGLIVSHFWDFGDGVDATGVTVNHTYKDDGVYTVTLTVTDDDGDTASKSAVKAVSNRPPIALFNYNVTTVYINELIRFNASGSYDADGSILSYFWDFGDGAGAHMVVVLDHAYTEYGNYTVTLTVTDDDGASSLVSTTIIVKASSGWSLALIAGIASGIAALTGTAIYAIHRRRSHSVHIT